jgi:hypothetical protein
MTTKPEYRPLEDYTKEEIVEMYRVLSRHHMESLVELSHLRKIIPPHLQEAHRLRDGVIQLMVVSGISDAEIAKALDTTSTVVARIRTTGMKIKKSRGRPKKA